MKWLGYHMQVELFVRNGKSYGFDTKNWLPKFWWSPKKVTREEAAAKLKAERLAHAVPPYLSPLWFPAATALPGQAPINA